VSAVYRLVLRSQATRGRLLGLGLLGVLAVVVGVAIGAQSDDPAVAFTDTLGLVRGFGLAVLVPVVALFFASAALGEPREDGTLVYLWLRPVPRWQLATAAALAALTVTLPLVVVPLVLSVLVSGAGTTLALATGTAAALAAVSYTGLFLLLGLRVRRALPVGLLYVLLWEGLVGSLGRIAERLAVRPYADAALQRLADPGLAGEALALPWALAVPVLAALAALALTTRALHRHEVS